MLKRYRVLVCENYRSSQLYPHKLCYVNSNELYWCQIGSFGAITRIMNIVPKREDLLKVAAAGPLAGFSLGLVLLLVGFFLPPSDGIGVIVDASVFHESLLVGGLGKYNIVMHSTLLHIHGYVCVSSVLDSLILALWKLHIVKWFTYLLKSTYSTISSAV